MTQAMTGEVKPAVNQAINQTQQASTSEKIFMEDNKGFVELLEAFGSDLTVANAARVSFNKESLFEPIFETDEAGVQHQVGEKLADRDAKLVTFLAKHNHITPFFHPQIQFRIRMPIYVAREWWRSQIGFARNEVSRRYVFDRPDCFTPSILRQRDANIKQGSKLEPIENNDVVVEQFRDFNEKAIAYYEYLLSIGVCPEQARGVLPQGMYTEYIETGSLAAYARLARLRTDMAAQKEIRDYAIAMSTLVEKRFPVSWKALMEAGL